MLFQIKHRWNGSVLFELECGSLRLCVEAAVRAKADLRAANLSDADLSDADLSDADLRDANLSAANLSDADLSAANLSDANLSDANLSDADLRAADLSAANLSDANLSAAKNVRLPTGEFWNEYLSQTVPALLTAGGRSLADVANEKHWSCHSWDNCPMAAAFGVTQLCDVPILFRPRAEQFVQLFDAGQIKLADIPGAAT